MNEPAPSSVATGINPPNTGRPARKVVFLALAGMLIIYFFSYFQRSAIPGTIFNEIQTDLALPATVVASLGAMFTYIYGGMQVFVGMATDRIGGWRALLFGGVILVIGSLLFPFSHSVAMLFTSRIITGFGASFMYLSLAKEIDLLFDKRHFVGFLGMVVSVGYLGAIAGTLPFQRLASWLGWRDALLYIGIASGLFLLFAFFALRKLNRFHPPESRLSLAPVKEVLLNPRSLPLLLCGLINFPIYFVIQSVLGKKFLEDVVGMGPQRASTFVLLMIVTSAAASFMGGISLRWIGHRRKPAAILAGALVLLACLVMLVAVLSRAPAWVFLTAYVALALSTGCGPAFTALMKELNHPEASGVSISIINGITYIGAGIVGSLAGLILDQFKDKAVALAGSTIYPLEAYATLFAVMAGLGALSVIIIAFVQETRGESRYEPPL